MSDDPLAERLAAVEAKLAAPPPRPIADRVLRLLPWLSLGHLLVGVPTLVISLVVAWGTFVQAEATQKIQQASAWPFLGYTTGNYNERGERELYFELANNGVGPALLRAVELSYRGKPVPAPAELLARCCGRAPDAPVRFGTAPIRNIALRPGDAVRFLSVPDLPINRGLVEALDRERWKVRVRACYCSVFEDCWTIDGGESEPVPVRQCPADWTRYRER
ncbi:hypothetical protein [Sphingomonas spermidinifaciens]|uniref:hypothetical protein n=1 Tax=Sphingomonas spermidinifaciens TaxID=1141889 RepID=UPI0011435C8F|nr:hypothetical protein [Sphingomonas spermidinifaciens]